MREVSFDPDATPVDGTHVVRRTSAHVVTAPATERSIRRVGHDQRASAPKRPSATRAITLVLAGAFVLFAALLIADVTAPSIFSGLRNVGRTPHSSNHVSVPTTSAPHQAQKPTGPGPVLSGVSPQSAKAGSTIVLSGSGFFSKNSQINAKVAGQPAPVTCPSTQRCLVVLPAAPKGATEVAVQIVTETGTSNSLEVHYG